MYPSALILSTRCEPKMPPRRVSFASRNKPRSSVTVEVRMKKLPGPSGSGLSWHHHSASTFAPLMGWRVCESVTRPSYGPGKGRSHPARTQKRAPAKQIPIVRLMSPVTPDTFPRTRKRLSRHHGGTRTVSRQGFAGPCATNPCKSALPAVLEPITGQSRGRVSMASVVENRDCHRSNRRS